jgi:hypothetical protein
MTPSDRLTGGRVRSSLVRAGRIAAGLAVVAISLVGAPGAEATPVDIYGPGELQWESQLPGLVVTEVDAHRGNEPTRVQYIEHSDTIIAELASGFVAFDATTLEVVHEELFSGSIWASDLSDDGSVYALVANTTLHRFRTSDWKLLSSHEVGLPQVIEIAPGSPDTTLVMAGAGTHVVRNGAVVATIPSSIDLVNSVISVAWGQNATSVVAVSSSLIIEYDISGGSPVVARTRSHPVDIGVAPYVDRTLYKAGRLLYSDWGFALDPGTFDIVETFPPYTSPWGREGDETLIRWFDNVVTFTPATGPTLRFRMPTTDRPTHELLHAAARRHPVRVPRDRAEYRDRRRRGAGVATRRLHRAATDARPRHPGADRAGHDRTDRARRGSHRADRRHPWGAGDGHRRSRRQRHRGQRHGSHLLVGLRLRRDRPGRVERQHRSDRRRHAGTRSRTSRRCRSAQTGAWSCSTVPVASTSHVDLVGYYADIDGSPGSRYRPLLTPRRVADTRDGTGGLGSAFGADDTRRLDLSAERVTYPAMTAAVLQITAVDATAPSFVTVFPGAAGRPNASTINLIPDRVNSNLTIVPVAPNGIVDIYNLAGTVDVAVDLVGVYEQRDQAVPDQAGRFLTIRPTRTFDTREAGVGGGQPQPLGPGSGVVFTNNDVGGQGVVRIVDRDEGWTFVLNLTAVFPTTPGFLAVVPDDVRVPDLPAITTSNVNFGPGEVRSTQAYVTADPDWTVFNSHGSTDVVIDAFGYITPADPITVAAAWS